MHGRGQKGVEAALYITSQRHRAKSIVCKGSLHMRNTPSPSSIVGLDSVQSVLRSRQVPMRGSSRFRNAFRAFTADPLPSHYMRFQKTLNTE
jgi:hypothetical protein